MDGDNPKQFAEKRYHEIIERARGRWTEILSAFGVAENLLKRKNQPCPMPSCTNSTDRFTYSDKFGEGNYYCRKCGAGGGFKLLMACRKWTAKETCQELERYLCIHPVGRINSGGGEQISRNEFIAKQIKRLIAESFEITRSDDAGRYLASRGLIMRHYPPSLRFHPAVEYFDINPVTGRRDLVGKFPAMLGCMEDQHSKVVALQRYYLQDGRRPQHLEFRRMLGNGNVGAAVRLGTPTDTLATCEGAENGLAIHIHHGIPTWPAMNASNLEKLWIPDTVRNLKIYGDNDADSCYDGQASAYQLARHARKSRPIDRRNVEVFIPKRPGSDWAEVYYQLAVYQQSQA